MRRPLKLLFWVVVAGVLALVAVVAWYLLTRDDAPEAVDLQATVELLSSTTTVPAQAGTATTQAGDSTTSVLAQTTAETSAESAGETGTETVEGASDADQTVSTAAESTEGASDLAGVWRVQVADDPGDLQDQPTVSFAGFRVDEVLSTIGEFTAVGRTADVSGFIELNDAELLAAEVSVMMSTLRTDNSFRDGRIYDALNTNEFPTATFTLTSPVALPSGLAEGAVFSGVAEGNLTIKGITNQASFSVEAQLLGDRILAVGTSDVTFSDYGVTAPTAPIVVSVEDQGVMEFQLFFTR